MLTLYMVARIYLRLGKKLHFIIFSLNYHLNENADFRGLEMMMVIIIMHLIHKALFLHIVAQCSAIK